MEPRPVLLIADDEPINLSLLRAFLEPPGYELICAGDGEGALRAIAGGSVDLALLDVMMPGLDGLEVTRRIKADETNRRIPVILLTALNGREDRIRGIEAGADDFICKPFDRAEVLARIRMLLRVKWMDDRLCSAYGTMVNLMGAGQRVLLGFDPGEFDFRSSLESCLAQILQRSGPDWDKPRAALVGLLGAQNRWEWHVCRADDESGLLLEEAGSHPAPTPVSPEPRVFFGSAEDFRKPEFEWLRAAAPFRDAANGAGYLSPDLCVLLLNYDRPVTAFDAAVVQGLATQSLFLRSLAKQVLETEDAFAYAIQALARAAEAKDESTGDHIQRVGEYCGVLAKRLGMDDAFCKAIRLQAQMHDVGKIHISPALLRKHGQLSPSEWEEMKKHTLFGAVILGEHPRLQMARSMALTHHEKADGSGYPFGLKGEEIPIEGRIIGIADQYDALRSRRHYKSALDHSTAVSTLTRGDKITSPSHFDRQVLLAFADIHSQFSAIYARLSA